MERMPIGMRRCDFGTIPLGAAIGAAVRGGARWVSHRQAFRFPKPSKWPQAMIDLARKFSLSTEGSTARYPPNTQTWIFAFTTPCEPRRVGLRFTCTTLRTNGFSFEKENSFFRWEGTPSDEKRATRCLPPARCLMP